MNTATLSDEAQRMPKSLRELSRAFYDTALAFQTLADAVRVLLIFIDGGAVVGHIADKDGRRRFHRSDEFQVAVDEVRLALGEVTP